MTAALAGETFDMHDQRAGFIVDAEHGDVGQAEEQPITGLGTLRSHVIDEA